MDTRIYKVVSSELWHEAEKAKVFRGAPIDLDDGFIHFSTSSQVAETITKHFAGQDDLLLLEVDVTLLGEEVRWERSRGGALFPHLYADMPTSAVVSVLALPLNAAGRHVLPDRFTTIAYRNAQ